MIYTVTAFCKNKSLRCDDTTETFENKEQAYKFYNHCVELIKGGEDSFAVKMETDKLIESYNMDDETTFFPSISAEDVEDIKEQYLDYKVTECNQRGTRFHNLTINHTQKTINIVSYNSVNDEDLI